MCVSLFNPRGSASNLNRAPDRVSISSDVREGVGRNTVPERSCSANAKCSLSLAIPTIRAKGPSGFTASITSSKAFADASVWAGRHLKHQGTVITKKVQVENRAGCRANLHQ
jgi:hypothetical protein